MTCGEAQELIEAVASGEPPDSAFTAHVSTCHACAAALAVAVRIEQALTGRPAAVPPANFSQTVMASIGRQRWQYDEHLDRAFNLTIAVAVVIACAAAVSLLNVGSVARLLLVAVDTLAEIPQQSPEWTVARPLPLVGVTAVVVTAAIGIWWWAERRSGFQDGDAIRR